MRNACDLAVLPRSRKQVLASLTKKKKNKEGKYDFFKTIHLLTAETDVSMVLYPAVCRTFEIRPRWKVPSDLTVMCSQVPFLVRFC